MDQRHARSSMTFSMGARSCIGQALATSEIQCILPRLVREFEFDVEQVGQPECFLTFRMAGYKLLAKPVNV